MPVPRLALAFAVLLAGPVFVRADLPAVEGVPWPAFRDDCRALLKGLDGLKARLPSETTRALHALLGREPADAAAARALSDAVQKLLDRHCLVGVHINPESRVKAARGPAGPALSRGRATLLLVKVHNEAGITPALAVGGPQLAAPGKKDPDRWLEAAVLNGPPFPGRLSGRILEYRVLRLTARQAGKREATFRFDVGQGTQDLGFRAEVPVLFAVRTP